MKILSSCEALPVWSNQPTCTFMQNKLCTRRISTSVPFQIVGAALTFASTAQLLHLPTKIFAPLRCQTPIIRTDWGTGQNHQKNTLAKWKLWQQHISQQHRYLFLVFCTLPFDLPSVFKCCAYLVLAEKPSLSATVIYAIYVWMNIEQWLNFLYIYVLDSLKEYWIISSYIDYVIIYQRLIQKVA